MFKPAFAISFIFPSELSINLIVTIALVIGQWACYQETGHDEVSAAANICKKDQRSFPFSFSLVLIAFAELTKSVDTACNGADSCQGANKEAG